MAVGNTEELFELYLKGDFSVRELGRISGIPWTTLRDRFSRQYGKDYAERRGGEGTIHGVLKEYLNDNNLSAKQSEEVKNWYNQNKDYLIELAYEDRKKKVAKLYSDHKILKDSEFSLILKEDIYQDFTYVEEN